MNSLLLISSLVVILLFINVTQPKNIAMSNLLDNNHNSTDQDWNLKFKKKPVEKRGRKGKDGLGRRLSVKSCGANTVIKERIINGVNSNESEHPWIVAILQKGGPHCAGSIINDRWILTAAHCLIGEDMSVFTIRAGSNKLSQGEIIKFNKVVIHAKFNLEKFVENDIALIHTTKSIKFSKNIQPVCLPNNSNKMPRASKVVAAGWGKTELGRHSNYLQDVNLAVIADQKCADKHIILGRRVFPSQLCTWTLNKDSCNGDSGGPVVEIVGGKSTLVGIVSSGSLGCANEFPGLNTKVSHFLKWIYNAMKKYKT